MAEPRIGRAVLELIVDDKPVKFALDQIKDNSKKTSDDVRGISQAVDLAVWRELGQLALSALRGIGTQIIALGERGADIDDVSSSFAGLSAQAGSTADVMLGALREGTAGVLSDFDLMKAANGSLSSGLIRNADDMRVLAAGSRALANVTGKDTKDAFEMLTGAISSGRTTQLRQLGLFVDNKKATEDFARAHGKTADQLSATEQAQAVSVATLAALRAKFGEAGGGSADFGELVAQAKVKVENFTDQLAVGVSRSPVLREGLMSVGSALGAAFGGNQQTLIQSIVQAVGQVAIVAVQTAGFIVEGARIASNAWDGLKFTFNTVMALLAEGQAFIARGIAGILETAASIPIIGSNYRQAATDARAFADDVALLGTGFRQQAQDALDSAAATNAGFDRVQTAIATVTVAMEDASRATVDLGMSGGAAITSLGDTADQQAPRVAENATKIADTFRALKEAIVLETLQGNERRLAELEFQKAAEIQKARELKEVSVAEVTEMVRLIGEKYALKTQAVMASADQIRDRETLLQQEIQLAQATGTTQQLLQIEFRKQKELESIQGLAAHYGTTYTSLVALITQKYALMSAAAQGHFRTVEQAAAAAGFKTRAELEAEAQKAHETYQRMLQSGLFTTTTLRAAREAAGAADQALDGKVHMNREELQATLLASTSNILRSLFGKSKAAAIAAALIDTYAAVAKAMSAYPWPVSMAPAAAALAAGFAQVQQIRATNPEGFATGTPGLDFSSFARGGQLSILHGPEAVIPRGSGHLLAAEIAAAMPGGDDSAAQSQMAQSLAGIHKLLRRATGA